MLLPCNVVQQITASCTPLPCPWWVLPVAQQARTPLNSNAPWGRDWVGLHPAPVIPLLCTCTTPQSHVMGLQMTSGIVGRSGVSNAEPHFPWDLIKDIWSQIHPSGQAPKAGKDAAAVLQDLATPPNPKDVSGSDTHTAGAGASGAPLRGKGRVIPLLQTQVQVQQEVLALQRDQLELFQRREEARQEEAARQRARQEARDERQQAVDEALIAFLRRHS